MKKNILTVSAVSIIISSIFNVEASGQNTSNVNTTNPAVTAPLSPATQDKAKEIVITDAWATKTMSPNNNSAAYMKINNPTDKEIVIIGASASTIANNVELHESYVDEKGVSRMRFLDRIVVPAKTTIELMPGAIHIMLFNLKKSLNIGDKFEIEVKIEGRSPLSVTTEVKEISLNK